MKKQIIAVLSAASMMSSSFVAMASTDTVSVTLEPTSGFTTLNLVNEKGSKSSVQSNEVKSGEKALHVLESGGGAITYLTVGVGVGDVIDFWAKGFEAGPDYILVDQNFNVWSEPWKGTSIHNNNQLGLNRYMDTINDKSGTYYDATKLPVQLLESKSNGWKHWRTRPEAFSKNGTSNLRFTDETFSGQNPNGGGYIDDVIVYYADGTIKNITNFEDAYDVEKSADGHHVYGLSANGAEESIVLSWRNPRRDDIAEIAVYEVAEDGSETLVDDTASCASDVLNVITVAAEDMEEKEFNVKLTLENGEEYVSNVEGMATDHYMYFEDTSDGVALNGWQYTDINAPYTSVEYDEVTKAEGGRSLRINFNSNDATKKVVLTNTETPLDAGTYVVQVKTRTANTGSTNISTWGISKMEFDVIEDDSYLDIEIPCRGTMKTLWVDDIEIYEYDIDEGVMGENLMVNGSFEEGYVAEVNYTTDVTINPTTGRTTYNLMNEKGSKSSIQSNVAHSGEKAMHVLESGGGAITYLTVGAGQGDIIDFWAKGFEVSPDFIMVDNNFSVWTEPWKDSSIHNNNQLGLNRYMDALNDKSGPVYDVTKLPVELLESRDDGWKHWRTRPEAFSKGGTSNLRFTDETYSWQTANGGGYIDDVIVYKADGTIRNITTFEDAYEVENSENGNYVYGLSANGADNSIILSWRNPGKDNISNISVYEVNADGSETLLNAEANCGAKSLCTYTVPADKYEEKAFKVKLTLSDGSVYSSYVKGQATNKFMYSNKTAEGEGLNGWTVDANDGLYTSVHYDTVSKIAGDRSLRIDYNTNDASKNVIITNDVKLDAGTYFVQLKTKYNNDGWGVSNAVFDVENDGTVLNIKIPCRSSLNTLWIDDIEIYSFNTGKKEGENLCVNGSFEKGYSKKTDYVTSGVYSGSKIINSLVSGALKAKTVVENNTSYDTITAVTFAALRKDGKIQKVWVSDSVNADKGQSVAASVDVEIPELSDGAYDLTVYSWNSESGLIPLIPAETVAE